MPRAKKLSVEIPSEQVFDLSLDDDDDLEMDLDSIPAPAPPQVEVIPAKKKRQLPEALKKANEERSRIAREKRMAEMAEAAQQKKEKNRARSPDMVRTKPEIAQPKVRVETNVPSLIQSPQEPRSTKKIAPGPVIPAVMDTDTLSQLRQRIIQEEIIKMARKEAKQMMTGSPLELRPTQKEASPVVVQPTNDFQPSRKVGLLHVPSSTAPQQQPNARPSALTARDILRRSGF